MKRYQVKINKQFNEHYPIVIIMEDDIILEFNKSIIPNKELISLIKFLNDNFDYKRENSKTKHLLSLNQLRIDNTTFTIYKDHICIEKKDFVNMSFNDILYLLNYKNIMFGNDITKEDIENYKVVLV